MVTPTWGDLVSVPVTLQWRRVKACLTPVQVQNSMCMVEGRTTHLQGKMPETGDGNQSHPKSRVISPTAE